MNAPVTSLGGLARRACVPAIVLCVAVVGATVPASGEPRSTRAEAHVAGPGSGVSRGLDLARFTGQPAHSRLWATNGFNPERFAEPPSDSRPTILWFWNGTVTPEIIDSQLADMRAQGIDEVLVFPFSLFFDAMRPRFFTEEWFDLIEHTLREAQRYGMHVWLFNDDNFPSGRGGGFVVNGGTVGDRVYEPRPDLRPDRITRNARTVEGGQPVDLGAVRDPGLRVEGGQLVVDAEARPGVTLLQAGSDWVDYDVSATVRVERGTAGLMVRSPDERNGYLIDLAPNGGLNVFRQVNGAFTLLHHSPPPAGFDPAGFHDLSVSLRGDSIIPSLDGVTRSGVRDGTFGRGRVGVRAVATQRSRWERLSVTRADGELLYEETFDNEEALAAFALPDAEPTGRLVAVTARPADGPGASDPARVVDLTELAEADRPWEAPEGRWRIEHYSASDVVGEGVQRATYLDLLDDEAVERFLDAVPGEYYRRFPWAFGTVLRGFADDEPFIVSSQIHFNAVPWSRSLDALLEKRGLNPASVLPAVFNDLGRGGRHLRGAFWRAVSDRFAAAYYEQQHRWMREHRVGFISNPLQGGRAGEGPAMQLRSGGNLNVTNQWAQIPGTDLISNDFGLGAHRMLSRPPASTAHQLGLERVYLEAFGVMGWGLTPARARQVIGASSARGVNFTVLHAAYTDPGFIPFAPPFQPINPWWEKSRPLNEWIGRAMEIGRARAPAETAVVQPQRAAEAWQNTSRAATIDSAFVGASHALEDRQVDFDLLDEGALDRDPALRVHAQPSDGQLEVGRQAYRHVVLPETPTLSLGAARTLARFVRDGGTLVAIGALPQEEAGGNDAALSNSLDDLFAQPGAGRAVHVDNPQAAAEEIADAGGAAATLQPPEDDIAVLRLRRAEERAFIVVNEADRAIDTTATFPAPGVPQQWDPDTGETGPAGVWRKDGGNSTAVSLHLEPHETTVVVLRPPKGPPPAHVTSSPLPVEDARPSGKGLRVTASTSSPGEFTITGARGSRLFRGVAVVTDPLSPITLGGDWAMRFEREGAQPVLRPLGSWTELDPAFSGSATYEREIDLDGAVFSGRRWILDLGNVRDVAEVEVNGRQFPARLWPPYRLDVTESLRPGPNAIRVRVTNTGANAHGEAQPSGLIGPVILRPERSVNVELEPIENG